MQRQNRQDRKEYDTVIFDLDGTLLNTLEDLKDAVNYVLQQHEYPLRSLEEIRTFVGNGIFLLVQRALPSGITEEEKNQAFLEFREYYTSHCQQKTRPYEGILTLLKELQNSGIQIAIVSNKNDAAVKQLADEYFPGLIQVSVGQREGIKTKPAPDSVNEVMQLLHTNARQALYVGDSEVDMATAENAKMDYVLVDWGFRHREELLKLHPVKVISRPEELLELIM